MDNYIFKVAERPEEFQQINQLNYQTFVEEIPQHAKNPDKSLQDKFDRENTYFITLNTTGELCAMLCIRDKRPFSLDHKIENLDVLLPPYENICEIRLLSIPKHKRKGKILVGLITFVFEHNIHKYDLAIISATVLQLKMYQALGFIPFAPLVGSEQAQFIPMYINRQILRNKLKQLKII